MVLGVKLNDCCRCLYPDVALVGLKFGVQASLAVLSHAKSKYYYVL
jgi:hypothetical protein